MLRVLRGVVYLLGALAVLAFAVALVARFSDGPIGPFAGGALVAGELVSEAPADWSFVRDVAEVELQLLEPPRSRTTWILAHEGRAYIPCGLPSFRLWKRWPHEALLDGRFVLRVGGKRYAGRLTRVTEEPLFTVLAGLLAQKYPSAKGYLADPEILWMFRLDPPKR